MDARTAPPVEDVEVLTDPDCAAALMDAGRRRLVEELREEPASAAGLARRLGESRQRLNYHLRALEDAGLVELQEERRRGNCVERVLRVTARRFVVDPSVLGALAAGGEASGDRFAATYLISLAARAIRELAGLREKAAREGRRLATGTVESRVELAEPADFPAFVEELSEAVAGVVARHDAPGAGGRAFRVWTGSYPAPPDEGDGEAEDDHGGRPRGAPETEAGDDG